MLTQFDKHKVPQKNDEPAKTPVRYSMFDALKQSHGQSVVLNETSESQRLYARVSTNYSEDLSTDIEPSPNLSHAKIAKPG